MILMLIRAFDIVHMVPIPMHPNHSVREQGVVSTRASHGAFEEHGVAHCFVGACAELVQEGRFHVSGEFLRIAR